MKIGAPPLDRLRVVEVGNFMAVPFCGMQLADLGAEVIKVENPHGGDLTAHAGPFLEDESSNFVRLNRNKRSVALDLKSEDGKMVFRRLAATADVVIENLRPGTMAGWAGPRVLSNESPRLLSRGDGLRQRRAVRGPGRAGHHRARDVGPDEHHR